MMGMELIEQYQTELGQLKEKMLGAQRFADKFPVFSKHIIYHKFTEEFTGKIADTYKSMYFAWGINRYFYREKQNITNYRGDLIPQYLWRIYINQVSLFDDYTDTGLYDIKDKVDVFFFDPLNTTFYATDEQIIPLLDALVAWYEPAKEENLSYRKDKKKRELMEQLEKLQ